jgi:prolyl-tRNA synthetase
VAAVVEATYDGLGLCWPREVAPADVHVVATGKDAAVFETADRISQELSAAGVRVLYDDRPKVSPGVKFKDAELVGVPTRLVVGKGLVTGTVELKDRRTGEQEDLPLADAVARIVAVVRG